MAKFDLSSSKILEIVNYVYLVKVEVVWRNGINLSEGMVHLHVSLFFPSNFVLKVCLDSGI